MSEEALQRVKPAPPLQLQSVANNPHRFSNEQHQSPAEGEHREKETPKEERAAVVTLGAHGASVPASYAQFIVDPDTHLVRIRIVDAATQKVLKEISPEEVANFHRDLERYRLAALRNRLNPYAGS